MTSLCDVQIRVNGEHTFHLESTRLHRSGHLMKLIGKAQGELDTDSDDDPDTVSAGCGDAVFISIDNVPGGPEAFELAAKFCYSNGDLVITSANVARLRCVAEVLDMTEDHGKANLMRRTESFLKNVIFWSWHEAMLVLRSCEPLLSYPESAHLVQRCVASLARKIETSAASTPPVGPGNASPTASHKSSFEPPRLSTASDSSFGSKSALLLNNKYWWFQDVSSLSVYLVEKLFKALVASNVDHKVLSRFLLHYVRKTLPVLGYNSSTVSPPLVAFSGSLCPSPKRKPGEELVQLNYSQNVQCEILETVVTMLASLEEGASSCKTLFGLLRVAFLLDASDACKMQLEQKVGSQLDTATLDSILVPALPPRNCSPLYDVDLVLRLVDHFLKGREALLDSPIVAAHRRQDIGFLAWLFDTHKDSSRIMDESSGPFSVHRALAAAGDLLDKYLSEIAADVHLSASKFEALAGALPDFARGCHDGLYRAIDIYLEAHPGVTESEAVSLCGVLNYQKLSMETCKHLTKNRTFPPFVSLQVLLAQQMQLRAAVQGCYTKRKKKSLRSQDASLVGMIFDSGSLRAVSMDSNCADADVVCRENDDLKVNLQAIQCKVEELEKLCKRMRLEMARHDKARRRLLC